MEQIKIYSAHLPPAERHLSRHWPKNRDPVPGQRQTGSAASRISLVWGTPAGAAPSRWSLAGKYYARARIVGLKSYRLVSVVSSCRKCSVRWGCWVFFTPTSSDWVLHLLFWQLCLFLSWCFCCGFFWSGRGLLPFLLGSIWVSFFAEVIYLLAGAGQRYKYVKLRQVL